ncbi:MAG: VacJ family lipoprotein [Rickettsiales bacterium]|jgi:phospholipid-binding lipoprotein MlaA|nr:VacJ family lipoprotein [Rickettsiales bacterium]
MKAKYTALLFLSACAAGPGEITPDIAPGYSRYVHDMNKRVLTMIRPAMDEYRENHSPATHRALLNFVRNLREPLTVIDSVLMLDFKNALSSLGRFAINSTIGILGIMDSAAQMGLARDKRDFGMVMGAWGVGMGGYFMLPLVGPWSVRDAAGYAVDVFLDPIIWPETGLILSATSGLLELYEGYYFIMATLDASVDSYETLKTMYLQSRKAEIDKHRLFLASPEEDAEQMDFDMEWQ